MAIKAWKLIQEVEELGGMANAIESGLPKMRIEESSAIRQANIDSGKEMIVGVNAYDNNHENENLEFLEVDHQKVKDNQINRLQKIKSSRNKEDVKKVLNNIKEAARTGKGNLLELSIKAAQKRATLGEISLAIENVYGRYKATIRTISGIYSAQLMENKEYIKAQDLVKKFEDLDGRRPRILIAKMGQDGHDRGAKVIATSFADIGFDVDIGPLFQTPEEAAQQAIENDVHILGISSLAAGHNTLVPEVIEVLNKADKKDIMVIAGGVIPKKDYKFLFEKGVAAVFGPGTNICKAAQEILKIMLSSFK